VNVNEPVLIRSTSKNSFEEVGNENNKDSLQKSEEKI
jgi:hypothetical protein